MVKLNPKPNNTLEYTDKPLDDVIAIKEGKLSSKVCSQFKFEPAAYTGKAAKNGKTARSKSHLR